MITGCSTFELSHRRILVTGASSGIGRATSILLSRLGAEIVLVGRRPGELQRTMLSLMGVNHAFEPFDLNNSDEIGTWMRALSARHGQFSGVVHCAGTRTTVPIRDFSSSRFATEFAINTEAAFALVAGFRHREVSKGGSIVLMSSIAALKGEKALSLYCAAKGAVSAGVRALAVELAAEGIRVNAIAAGIVETEMTQKIRQVLSDEQFEAIRAKHPLGIGTAEDIASSAAFLLGDGSRWITGTTMIVDGGFSAH